MMTEIIARREELTILNEMYNSNEAEFIAIYGRRRIGKTYLIRHFAATTPCIFFQATGLKDGSLGQQLSNFTKNLQTTFSDLIGVPTSWMQAFEFLNKAIATFAPGKKIIIFLDELPWMATAKSQLIQALDYHWNTSWVYQEKIKLVICGSAASWMLDNIVNAKGGLHNRLTRKINLQPFSLSETKEYLWSRGVKLNNQHIIEIYMAIGGVAHYLKEIKPGLSAKQNISKICFTIGGLLANEYDNLLASLFNHSEKHAQLLGALAKKPNGLDKAELVALTKNSSVGGRLTARLDELVTSGFIKKFIPYGKKTKNVYYKLIDEYTLFYLKWIIPNKNNLDNSSDNIIWEQLSLSPGYRAWSGYAFEAICYKHITMIKKAMNLERISAMVGNWRYIPKLKSSEKGAQIDLIFDRLDNVISLCEIKYCQQDFIFNKKIYQELQHKQAIFTSQTKSHKQIFWCLITSQPVNRNSYFDEIILHNVIISDLF